MKLLRRFWCENICPRKNPVVLNWRCTRKRLFNSDVCYGGCDRVSCAEMFRERRVQWNGLGGFTGEATTI